MAQRYTSIPVTDTLAAERTDLAYARSAFAFFVAGVSAALLLESPLLVAFAHALLGASVLVPAFGFQCWPVSRTVERGAVHRCDVERGRAGGAA